MNFTAQRSKIREEKVYLHTDKPYYSAGESIWFRGYVVNATTHVPDVLSQYLYVELIDKSDSVVTRVKIVQDSVGFAGYIPLNAGLPEGDYVLRAYTNWMRNAGDDFFFKRNIRIDNPLDETLNSGISFGTMNSGKLPVTISFTGINNRPLRGQQVELYFGRKGEPQLKMMHTTDVNGNVVLQLPADTSAEKSCLDVSIEEPSRKYRQRYYFPTFSNDYDVQFFPESGALLPVGMQTIAFKAIGRDGLSVEVEGKVFSEKGTEVAAFSSFHKGMGKFELLADSGVAYYAVLKSAAGVEKRFDLPVVQDRGAALRLSYQDGKLEYSVTNRTSLGNDALSLLVHCRGRFLALACLKDLSGQITESLLPPGIVSLSVVDTLGKTYCERLCFVLPHKLPVVSMQSDKPSYGKREPVELVLRLQSADGIPCLGSYSLSVTDSKVVRQDSTQDNILNSLLLSSDLKGYVEHPGSYFTDNPDSDRCKLEVLMLTQGWRRFNTADVVKGVFQENVHFMEVGQSFTGRVVDAFNRPLRECKLMVQADSIRQMTTAITDSLGRYVVEGINFPDSTAIRLHPTSGVLKGATILPDSDNFPLSKGFLPIPRSLTPASAIIPDDYLQQSKQKYFAEGGIRPVNLKTVTVKGKNHDVPRYESTYVQMIKREIPNSKFEDFSNLTPFDIVAMEPGIEISDGRVIMHSIQDPKAFLTKKEKPDYIPALLLVNDVKSTFDAIQTIPMNQIAAVYIFKNPQVLSLWGEEGKCGVIDVILKSPEASDVEPPRNSVVVKPLGYQKPAQFYLPKYDVDSIRMDRKADLRTTIYWNPKVVTDSNGLARVSFYTADNANDYCVVLEGVSAKGEICRYAGKLKRREE